MPARAGYTDHFLWTRVPAIAATLRQKAESGCRARFPLRDPDGDVTRQREVIEGVALAVPTRIRMSLEELVKWAVADAYDICTVPAFLARWWGEYAIARDPRLDAHVADLHERAAQSTDPAEAKALLEEVSHIRYETQRLEPGQ